MTENEAIRILGDTTLCTPLGQAAFVGIEAIKEVQKYRAVGTVEEIKEVLQIISEGQDDVDESGISTGLLKQLLEYVEYAKIGTVKECREAMEKQRAKKPSILNKGKAISQGQMFVANHFKCPNCGIKQAYFDGMPKYCDNCGQKLEEGGTK